MEGFVMKSKYDLLIALKTQEYAINEIMMYSKENPDCFDLLKGKFDDLCTFMNTKERIKDWDLWGSHEEVKRYCNRLRETSIKALCDMEKYQSNCVCNQQLTMSKYLDELNQSVKKEFDKYHMNEQSKVLFIGSGAFPVSAFTIAKELKAKVIGVDIDIDATVLAKKIARTTGLSPYVQFTNAHFKKIKFISEATHIVIASLVKNKMMVLNDLKDLVNSTTKVIVRYGNGLKSIFNYPFDAKDLKDWHCYRIEDDNQIYDTMILQRKDNE